VRLEKKYFNSDKNLTELLSGGTVAFILQLLGLAMGYALTLAITKLFGAKIFGIYSLTYTTLMVLTMVSTLGLEIAILKLVGRDEGRSSQSLLQLIYGMVIPSSVIVSILFILFSYLYAESIFKHADYRIFFMYSGMILIFSSSLSINTEYLRANNYIFMSEFLRNILRPLLILVFLFLFYKFYKEDLLIVYALITSMILSSFISIFAIVNGKAKNHNSSPSYFSINITKKDILSTGLRIQLSLLAAYLISNMGLYFIGAHEDAESIGLAVLAIKLSSLVYMPLMVLNKICAPKISNLYHSNQQESLQKYITQVSKIAFYIALVIATVLIVASNSLLSFFGDEFSKAGNILVILIASQFVCCASGSVGIFLNMTGNEHIYRNISVIVALISLGLYVTLVPFYGAISAVIILALSQALLNIISAVYIKFKLGYITWYYPLRAYFLQNNS